MLDCQFCVARENKHESICLFFSSSTLIALYLSFGDAGNNSSSGAISGNTGEKSDPCREKAEGGIHNEVTLWFREKGSHPWNEHPPASSFPCLPALRCTPTHTSPAYYLRFVKIHFTLTGIFQPSKPVLICLTSQSSSNSVKSAKPARPSFFSFFFLQTTLNTPLPVL